MARNIKYIITTDSNVENPFDNLLFDSRDEANNEIKADIPRDQRKLYKVERVVGKLSQKQYHDIMNFAKAYPLNEIIDIIIDKYGSTYIYFYDFKQK